MNQAEDSLKHKDVVGVTALGRQGICATKAILWSRSDQKERRSLIQSEARRAEEHARQARAVEMGAQGAWTTWSTTDRKFTWRYIWKYETLRSVFDLLSSPGDSQQALNAVYVTRQAHYSMSCHHALLYSTDIRRWRHPG